LTWESVRKDKVFDVSQTRGWFY